MVKQLFRTSRNLGKRLTYPQANTGNQLRSIPLLYVFTIGLFLGLVSLILCVTSVTPAQMAVKILELPSSYLPGSRLPKDTMCYTPGDEHNARCSIHYVDHDVYFNFDAETKIITRSIVPAPDYTLGMLIATWGTPTGSTLDQSMVYVYWNTRSALLYTASIQPDSQVEFILYDLEPHPSSPWRGFRSSEVHS